jgi:hypothetical protein
MKVKEVIEKVNTNEYWSIYEFEEEFNLEVVDTCVGGIGYHLKYEEMTNVYKCDDGFVGVSGAVHLYDDNMEFSDCNHKCTAEEYKQILAPRYVPIRE